MKLMGERSTHFPGSKPTTRRDRETRQDNTLLLILYTKRENETKVRFSGNKQEEELNTIFNLS